MSLIDMKSYKLPAHITTEDDVTLSILKGISICSFLKKS